ncbi:thiol reductant ABC exporter subunit CydD [Pseudoclavibacter albus]|uniref:thiol reductant ABC exporter subunit CydD n=1 Tax=Pseudoclavibacter albus TaxID=272241 RepID=UPI0009F9FDB2|nr:thiol reductant ABC exporter subunit CydD [Pseudoclavibacter alba]
MRPLDPRLLRRALSARRFLVGGGALGVLEALALIVSCWCLSTAIAELVAGASFVSVLPFIGVFALAVVTRAASQWIMGMFSARAAAKVQLELRSQLLDHLAEQPAEARAHTHLATLSQLAASGLNALDAYFARYVPELIRAALVTPVLIAAIALADPLSAVAILATIPCIPVFMILIGRVTERAQSRRWDALTNLARGYAEIVEGLATLKIFGRARRQAERIRTITEEHRASTMGVLRYSFLSGFALELLASIAVALVAVSIGVRLVNREMLLQTGIFALLLAPEAYLPLRQVGAQFHAAADGLSASNAVLDVLDEDADASPLRSESSSSGAQSDGLKISGLTLEREGRIVVRGLDLVAAPGSFTVLSGPSGAGKSSILAAIRGSLRPAAGTISCGGTQWGETRAERAVSIAWSGQGAMLFGGTVRDNLSLGESTGASDDLLHRALELAALRSRPGDDHPVDGELRLDDRINELGHGISGGQAQRLALARAIARHWVVGTPLILLDEPTSALDEDTEARIVASLRELASRGAIVVAVSHREALWEAADQHLEVPLLELATEDVA